VECVACVRGISRMIAKLVSPTTTLTALANEWRQLMRAAEEPGVSDATRRALIERADAVLDRLVETPTNAGAVLVAELLFRPLP
jgi:hypothetical protein